ncbi:hypothetical protein ACIPW5_33745 [Streptomyces sp. NPDC090077]|uniref:hypothetical protein n=1 Tax=Streptomyces sp. NPDC090077 TaxID=3365938 RepID=UPI0038262DFB
MDQGWAAVLAGGVGILSAVGGALVGGLAAVRGARIGAETNAAAVLAQGRLQAAGAHDLWVRQERQKAYLQVMDCYSQFNRACVQYRDQLKETRPLDDPTMDLYVKTLITFMSSCSHLALLGPASVQVAGAAVRTQAERFVGTIRLWNDELAEGLADDSQADLADITDVWWDILAEDGSAMRAAYLEFLQAGQNELLRFA